MSVVTEIHKRVHHFCEARSAKVIIVYEYDRVQYKEFEWTQQYGYAQIIKDAASNSGVRQIPKV